MKISCKLNADNEIIYTTDTIFQNSLFKELFHKSFDSSNINFRFFLKPDDIVSFEKLSMLGNSLYEIANELDYFIKNNIHIFIKDNYGFSTINDTNNTPANNQKITTITSILDTILNDSSLQKQNRGKTKALINNEFINAYWEWQMYDISTINAIAKANLSRRTFYSLSYQYERTLDYRTHLEKNATSIICKPKRGKISEVISWCLKKDIDLINMTNIEIQQLVDCLIKINHIDYWRHLLNFHKSKEYNDNKAKSKNFAPSLESIVEKLNENPERYVLFSLRPQ